MGQQNSIQGRPLPAELMHELFASMPLENAFCLLVKLPNGLLAKNVQKMIKSIKMALNENKWNVENLPPNLTISNDGIVARQSGLAGNIVRAILPIPKFIKSTTSERFSPYSFAKYFTKNLCTIFVKPTIDFYYEVQILNGGMDFGIRIGFCDQHFPLEYGCWLGWKNNSIGFGGKDGIWICGSWTYFKNANRYFEKGDFVGIGIINQANAKMCFVTLNGKLIGIARLPLKFAQFEIFPAVDLICFGNSIRLNFSQDKWLFKDFNQLL